MQEVVVSIGAPRRHPDGDWECPFLIEGLGSPRLHKAGGVDALQALILALDGLWKTLDRTGSRFQWLNDQTGSGIPRQVPTGFGRLFEERVNSVIERETARYWKSALKARKADIALCQAELEKRKAAVTAWEKSLEGSKANATNWEASLKQK
jgi:hypothetical protein